MSLERYGCPRTRSYKIFAEWTRQLVRIAILKDGDSCFLNSDITLFVRKWGPPEVIILIAWLPMWEVIID